MKQHVEVDGRALALSNLDKVLYPACGFTKAHVLDYYLRIAPVLLPHLRDRPLTLKRYPNGVDGQFFYEKNCPRHRPDWIRTARAMDIEFCVIDGPAALAWAVNLADLEMHTPLARAQSFDVADSVVFDLDPGPPAGVRECASVALHLRALFAELKLDCYAKTSGSKGMQLYVPARASYAESKSFARAVAETLERAEPELVVSNMRKTLRKGKVLVDWSQNDLKKTTVCVYSLRARERPTVSTPVTWDEVAACAAGRDPLVYETHEVLARVERHGDLFAPLLDTRATLPRLR